MKIHKLILLLETNSSPINELGLAITIAMRKGDRTKSVSLIKAMDKHFQRKTIRSKKATNVLEKLFQNKASQNFRSHYR